MRSRHAAARNRGVIAVMLVAGAEPDVVRRHGCGAVVDVTYDRDGAAWRGAMRISVSRVRDSHDERVKRTSAARLRRAWGGMVADAAAEVVAACGGDAAAR